MSDSSLIKRNKTTLDSWLSPLVEKFSIQPESKFSRYSFGFFNNQEIFYYAVNGEMCFTLEEFAKYMNESYDNVKRAFNRLSQKRFSDSQEFILKENLDYIKMARNECYSRDKLSLSKKGKDAIFLTFLGIWKLLPTFRNDLPAKLYYWFGKQTYDLMKRQKDPSNKKEILIELNQKESISQNQEDFHKQNKFSEWNNEREDRFGRQFD